MSQVEKNTADQITDAATFVGYDLETFTVQS